MGASGLHVVAGVSRPNMNPNHIFRVTEELLLT